METGIFKDTISELLTATGYNLKQNSDQLGSFKCQKSLQPFFDWFVKNVSKENCVTYEEMEEFKKLEENNEALFGEDLEAALALYNNQTDDSKILLAGSLNETFSEELDHLKEQLHAKESLLSILKSSTLAAQDDLCKLYNQQKKAESRHVESLKNVFAEMKVVNAQLLELKETLKELKENLTELDRGSEQSADEGIGTLASDTLNTSSMSNSSTLSLRSTYSNVKAASGKYLCQMSFHKYEKYQKQFSRSLDMVMQKLNQWVLKSGEFSKDVEPALELKYIMNRLCIQKQSLVKNMAEVEGIKFALEKSKEINSEIKNDPTNITVSELRSRLNLECNESDLEESFVSNEDNLSEVCKKWAEFQTLKPVHDRLLENIECANNLIVKMNEIISVLKAKLTTDKLMQKLLHIETLRVESSVELYTELQEMIKQRLEATKDRLEVMEANAQEYADYCALPLEKQSKLIQILAAVLETDKGEVFQALNTITENSRKQHDSFCELTNKQIQTITFVEHNMNELYQMEVQNPSHTVESSTVGINAEVFTSIKKSLDEMSNEINDTLKHTQILQENGGGFEYGNEVEEMLMKNWNSNGK